MKKGIWKKYGMIMLFIIGVCLLAACSSPGRNVKERAEESIDEGENTKANVDNNMEDNFDESTGENSDKGTEEVSGENPDESNAEGVMESVDKDVEENLPIYGEYFKAGNAMYRLSISEAAPQEGGFLYISILRRDLEYSRYNTGLQEFHVVYKEGEDVYEVKDEITGQNYRITFGEDGTVIVEGEAGEAEELGTFYAFDTNLLMADIFERPLCHADLIGLSKQDLRILRNQFYAVYGRKFQDESLREHFESKSWYQGNIDPNAFDDEIFGRLEKSNIAFLQEAEDRFDEKWAEEEKKAYEGLAEAPYLELLAEEGEVAVNLQKDAGSAKDMGLYYEVQGSISLPVVLTQDEYRLLHQGEKLEIVMDELTGETAELSKGDGLQSAYIISQGDYQSEGDLVYDEELGGYRLWEGSDDTVFRKVYEGNIYVLKGAIDEYVGYFEMPEDEIPEGTSEYGEMEFTGDDSEETYWANRPVWDKKGYLKAMFFFGD